MEISNNIIKVIQDFEGYEPIARHLEGDPKNVITGGFGTIVHPNGIPVKVGDKFPRDYAIQCLIFEMGQKTKRLNEIITQNAILLNQNQFDALTSFAYNVGVGKLERGTTMGDALWSDNIQAMADAFLAYVYGTKYFLGFPRKVKLPGLVNRRNAERALFLS